MKTPKRIMDLAGSTFDGHRASKHEEFRAVVAANGYVMPQGGYVKDRQGATVCRGWAEFSARVLTGAIVLHEPAITQDEFPSAEPEAITGGNVLAFRPTRGLLPEVDRILDRREAESLDAADVSYFYTTRVPTVSLSDMTTVRATIVEEATAIVEGKCESGAALDCAGAGFRRILPESMLPGQDRTALIQCTPCYEWSAVRYVTKLHGQKA